MGYISNFIVYIFAMIGVIMLALFVFKYTTGARIKNNGNPKDLKITETLSLTPRKTLYIVETDGERFLIAGDAERTTLISKLETKGQSIRNHVQINNEYLENSSGIYETKQSPYSSLMKSLAKK